MDEIDVMIDEILSNLRVTPPADAKEAAYMRMIGLVRAKQNMSRRLSLDELGLASAAGTKQPCPQPECMGFIVNMGGVLRCDTCGCDLCKIEEF